MPSKLPEGVQIQVSRRSLPSDYEMPTMAMSVDHYSVGFLVSGDRRTITPQQTYDAHAGDVTVMPPYLYHRTISLSSTPYESYLIKFTQQAVEPLIRTTAPGFLEDMMERKIHHVPESARARIASYFEDMLRVYTDNAPYRDTVLQGLLLRLLTLIHEERAGGSVVYFPSSLSTCIVDTLVRMEQRYAEDLRLADIASELGYSQAHLSRLFSQQLGVGFSLYLSRIRLRHVYELLSSTDMSVSEIALACGYCSGDYLSTRFRSATGMTPREFRSRARQNAQASSTPVSAAFLQ